MFAPDKNQNQMNKELLNKVLVEYNYFEIYALTVVYFLLLYFALGYLFLWVCKVLERKNILEKVVPTTNPNKNIAFEIKNSFLSILVFGFSGVAMVYLVREGFVILKAETLLNTLLGVVLLTLWNELHFFVVHRMMHIPFLYRTVHKIHHQSKIPSVFSVYSFHWLEALLLSLVPISIAPFFSVSASAIFLYPLASILLNYAGHCNYRFGTGKGPSWKLIGTRHSEHHFRNTKNYGFAMTVFDWLFSSTKKNK